MPSYKLTYFDARGRAEVSRVLFAAAGKAFEDVRIKFEDWPELKPKTPQGTLPVLEVDGKKVSQSTTIARHIAREFKLYGKDNKEATMIDQIFDTIISVFDEMVSLNFSKSPDKDELVATFRKEKLPRCMEILENIVKESGKGGFAVGSSLTMADIILLVYIEGLKMQDSLEKFPKLQENRKATTSLPKIKAYLAKRPEAAF